MVRSSLPSTRAGRYGWLDVRNETGRRLRPAGQLPSERVKKPGRLRSIRIVEALSVKVLRKSGSLVPSCMNHHLYKIADMKTQAAATLWCGLAFAIPCLAQQFSPEVLLLGRLKGHIRQKLADTENYTCVETIARSTRKKANGRMELEDTLRLEVARVGGRELFSFPGERTFGEKPLRALVDDGLTADGLFASFAHDLFATSIPAISYAGESGLSPMGGHVVQYNFRFPLLLSHYTLTTVAGSANVAWSGSFSAETDDLELLRLRVQADDIPVQLGLSSVVTEIEYGKHRLDTGAVQLPQTAVVSTTYTTGVMDVNHTEFSQCRAFSAESTLSFADPAPAETSPLKITPREAALPENLTIPLRLNAPIEFDQAAIGDPISATVDANITQHGRRWLEKGATVSGRIRRLEQHQEYIVVDLEFSEILQDGVRLRLNGIMYRSDLAEEAKAGALPSMPGFPGRSLGRVEDPIIPQDAYVRSSVPGVASFVLRTKPYRIPGGFRMVWKTSPQA